MELEHRMRALHKFAVTAVFTLTCFVVPVRAADRAVAKELEKAPTAAVQGPAEKAVKKDAGRSPRRLDERVKALEQRYNAERALLARKVKEMLQRQQQGSKEDPESVRQQYRKIGQQLKELQKEQAEAVRREHLEHQPLIDATKEEVKEKVRERRGHGD